MKNLTFTLLLLVAATAACAQNMTLLNDMVAALNSNTLSSFSSSLTGQGYKEVNNAAFRNNSVRVFTKTGRRGPEMYILEYCNNELTGYYTSLTNPENLILKNDVVEYGYKMVADKYNKYRKKDITVDFIYDPSSQSPWSAQSDAFGAIKYYVHISKKNTCHNDDLESPLAPYFSFSPSSVQTCIANLKLKQDEMVLALAKSAFIESTTDAATGVVQYNKDKRVQAVQYCQGNVQAFTMLIEQSDGKRLEENLKKEGFKLDQEQTADNNQYARSYTSKDYMAVLRYFGDVADEEDRTFAYLLLFSKKENPCKK